MWKTIRIDEFVDCSEDVLVTADIGKRVRSVFLHPWQVVLDLYRQVGGTAFSLVAGVGGGKLHCDVFFRDVDVHVILVVGHDCGEDGESELRVMFA